MEQPLFILLQDQTNSSVKKVDLSVQKQRGSTAEHKRFYTIECLPFCDKYNKITPANIMDWDLLINYAPKSILPCVLGIKF